MRTILPFTADECFAPNSDNAGSGSFDKKVFSADNGGGSASSGSTTRSKSDNPGGGGIALKRDTGTDGGHSKSDAYADQSDSPTDTDSTS